MKVIEGDCVAVMATMEPDSIDAIVCDPPYSLGFMGRQWDEHPDEDSAFGYYLAGLVDGEGSFRVQRHSRDTYSCAFSIHLRLDDRAILEQARKFLGVGSITTDQTGDRSPMARLNVQAKADCLRVVEVFTRYPLRAKKLRDFLHWAEAVIEWNEMKRGHRWSGRADWSRLEALKASIERAREYREIPWSGNGYQDWTREWAEEAYRIAKPGAHLLAFSGTRTYHRMTSGLEDAGWEIRDCLVWAYASGFPKSLDVSKAIDKAAGAEREVVGRHVQSVQTRKPGVTYGDGLAWHRDLTAPATDAAKRWQGWGTALKPAWEPIVLARKPLTGTVAGNVERWGTGALNIDGTRLPVAPDDPVNEAIYHNKPNLIYGEYADKRDGVLSPMAPKGGRWPPNLLLTDAELFDVRNDGVVGSGASAGDFTAGRYRREDETDGLFGFGGRYRDDNTYGDTGGYARFFLVPKSSRSDREPDLPDYAIALHRASGQCDKLDGWESTSPGRATSDETETGSSATSSSGKPPTAPSQTATSSITSTATSRTTASRTLSSPTPGISADKDGRSTDAVGPATSPSSSRRNRCGRCGKPLPRFSTHPTQKPTALMRHLVRLVTPPGGVVLDPFLGSGTTLVACIEEGFSGIGIDLDADYVRIAEARLNGVQQGIGL